ncbi:MAG: hypothetical protein R3F56_21250 [Planctomycetota bacterium]
MSRTAARSHWLVAVVVALASLTYAALWQRHPSGDEVLWFDAIRGHGQAVHLRSAWRAILERADTLSYLAAPQTLVCWWSALCTGVALAFVGLGARRLVPAVPPHRATLLLATSPAIVCGATASQPFALVLVLAAIAAFSTTFACERGGWFAVALAGATAGCGYAFDTSGLLVAAWLLPFAYVVVRRDGRSRASAAWLAIVAAASFAAVVAWIAAREPAPPQGAETMSAPGNLAAFPDPVRLLAITAKEALRAFLPASLVALVCAFRAKATMARITVCAAVIGGVATAWMHGDRTMDGMLQLSLAVPASLVVLRHLGARGQTIVVVIGAALGLVRLEALAGDGHPRAFYLGLRAEVGIGSPLILTSGTGPDHVACILWFPAATPARVDDLVLLFDNRPEELRAAVEQHVRQAWADGRRVFMTHDAEAALRRPAHYDGCPTAAVLLHTVLDRFRIVQRESGGFRAKELLPRT